MSIGTIAPVPEQQFFADTGVPLAGGFLWTYVSGTSTPLAVYQDSGLISAYPNPILLDAAGRPGPMYFQSAAYKTYLTDANGVPVGPNGGYTDPVSSTALNAGSLDVVVFAFGGDPTSPITVTSYPSGTTYDKCMAGSAWYPLDSNMLSPGTYKLRGMLLATSGTVKIGLFNLTDGTPDTPLVELSSMSTTGESQLSTSITFAAAGSPKTYALKAKTSGGANSYGWTVQLLQTA